MIICGVDEVGRGPFAGPIVSAAVVFDGLEPGDMTELRDSKQLSTKKLEKLYHHIIRSPSTLRFGFGIVTEQEIDTYGIDHANQLAHYLAITDARAVTNEPKCSMICIDGTLELPKSNEHEFFDMGVELVYLPQGDDKIKAVSAASIIAKTLRDRHMRELAREHSYYGWDTNVGYGTKEHREAILKYGPSVYHRRTFLKKLNKL